MVTTALPADLSQFVESEVAAGRYSSPDEVVHRAVRLLKEGRERWRRLKADIDEAYEQVERGEVIRLDTDAELEEFFEGIIRRGRERLGLGEEQE